MAFSFGFSGDDIDIDDTELNNETPDVAVPQGKTNFLPELVKANKHDMDEWLSILPSQISFNTLAIGDTPITISRREIFDIRTQLMAEDSEGHDNEELIAGLEEGDLKPNFYEGGFKTWECALDLAKLVTGETSVDAQTDVHIIELGAGTAVPSLALFAHALSQTESTQRKTRFTFADYNESVLRLVTLPNLILTWQNSQSQTATSVVGGEVPPAQDEELDITPELLDAFKSDLVRRGISLEFISGAWSPEFVDFAFCSRGSEECQTLVLASETIYSPSSLVAFSETLLALLRHSSTASRKSRALVAAKKVYFGVGGGVDEFLSVLKNVCADELEVQQKVDVQFEGVGRVVLEITPTANAVK
ncbi:hypothetical protein N7532_011074 [Penicillium argentinense]|uniref:protein-histidine N-methyltransferase n=1 Tax=Penicillium argentinense TaxID=1131581 RepID=A0A9W9EHW6_9EURO|nr:uncharacterized protein N7532_011074 [Penicillium argentinense]KAJ5082031.1 hypothetical protein N7532_011074 [Penicillium argentinense]